MNDRERVEELVALLNHASSVYYSGQGEIMSNYEWDAMFDELTELETKTGYVLPESPTRNTGYEEESKDRETHEYPALSLAKQSGWRSLKNGQRISWFGSAGSWTG